MDNREKAIRILEGNYKSFVLRHKGELITVNELLALLKAQEPEAVNAPKPDSDIGCWYDITHNYTLEQVVNALKAQEPVKPIMHYVPDGKRSSAAWQCGNCLIDIGYGANYCYNCGRAVKWG